jgi:site-specific DNA-methyltransferase (adenine-specific)
MAKVYYQDEQVTVYHGDCLEITEWLDADVMITDPPYGVAFSSGWNNEFREVRIRGDHNLEARDLCLEKWGNRAALVFGTWKRERPKGTKAVLIWDKGTVGMGDLSIPWFPCTEEIYVLGGGWVGSRTSAVLRKVSRNVNHPTEKPIDLLGALMSKCPPGTIADPFMGSGSTLVAAKALGRRAIGIEIEEQYCEIAAERCQQNYLFA